MHLVLRADPHLALHYGLEGRATARLHGELDIVLVQHLRADLDALTREVRALTLDIRPLSFCDATGLGLLARCALRMREREAPWRLLCDQPRILRLIRLTDLAPLLCPMPSGGPDRPTGPPPRHSPVTCHTSRHTADSV
ncbi:STAS domain-containing protein [Streptomyces sp. SBC-4]|nr:STAS domain-containing protein [Streptomyces sp. SBC-4]MDV5145420.1 STAS domain-containing protein [Streptomyces sp. SBC-4]